MPSGEPPAEAAAGQLACLALEDAHEPTSSTSSGSDGAGAAGRDHGMRHARDRPGVDPAAAVKAEHAKAAFAELLPMVTSSQLVAGEDPAAEAEHWSVFADVFEQEVRHQARYAAGSELGLDARRQILADILVWAEVTQARYDQDTASFVTEPHDQDPSFRRIGQLFKAAKAQRGLAR